MSFSNRHIGIDKESEKIMLDYLGVNDTETLIKETIPNEIRLKKDITLEKEMSEAQFLDHIYKLSQENKYFKNYIGRGYHESILPRNTTEYFRKPRMVYCIYSLPSRSCSR